MKSPVRVFRRQRHATPSARRTSWLLLNLLDAAIKPLDAKKISIAETLEVEAVDAASIYEDVVPALAELKSQGIRLFVATSLSRRAATRFIERNSIAEFLSGVYTRDDAAGVKTAPLLSALGGASLSPGKTMFLTDSLEGIKVARSVGVLPILMMNDPDEALRLALHNPAGGIVSLHEMPDFIRLIIAQKIREAG